MQRRFTRERKYSFIRMEYFETLDGSGTLSSKDFYNTS